MRILWCLAALLTFGCSTPKMATSGPVGVVAAGQLPPPLAGDQLTAPRPNPVGPFDTLTVELVGILDQPRDIVVDANGRMAVPIAGELKVAGKNPGEIATMIRSQLRAGYVRNPQVIVNVKEVASQNVTVDGAVTRPGIYPIRSDMTMMRAIARAEGLSDRARERHVVVFRKVAGHDMAALYDLEAIRLGNYPDPRIYPNDVVVVGNTQARALFPLYLQAAASLLSPLVLLLR